MKSRCAVPAVALFLCLVLVAHGPAAPRPKINLQVRQADLRDVFVIIARFAKVNVLVSKEVKGKVSLELVGVDYLRAMDAIARLNGYEILLRDGVVCVGDKEAIRRVRGRGFSQVLTLKPRRSRGHGQDPATHRRGSRGHDGPQDELHRHRAEVRGRRVSP